MECGKLTAKLRDAVPVIFIEDGKEVKRLKNIEIPDEILPDLEAGSPIIAGDIANVLRFFMIRDASLIKDDVYPFNIADRQIKKEIIALTTTSDEAYIIGYIG